MPAAAARGRRSRSGPAAAPASATLPPAAPRRSIRKASSARGGDEACVALHSLFRSFHHPQLIRSRGKQGLSALLGGLSIGPSSSFWTPPLIEYFERVSAIRADADGLFAQIGLLAEQHARVVSGAGEPTAEMTAVGRADAEAADAAAALDSARRLLAARTDARLVELGGDACCVEMRIRRNIDGSLERKVELCLETLREARQQYAAAMEKEGWRPPADCSAVWTYEPSLG